MTRDMLNLDNAPVLRSLSELADLATSGCEPERLARAGIEAGIRSLAAEGGAIALFNSVDRSLRPWVRAGVSGCPETALTLIGVAQSGRVFIGEQEVGGDVLQVAAVPLMMRRRVLGVLWIHHSGDWRFSPVHVAALKLIASEIAPVVEAERQSREWDGLTRTLGILREIGEASGGFFEPVAVTQIMILKARQLLEGDSAGVACWEGSTLRCYSDYVPMTAAPQWERMEGQFGVTFTRTLEPGRGAMGLAYSSQRPVVVSDYRNWDNRLDDAFASVVAVPLFLQAQCIGSLIVRYQERRELTEREVELMSLLATQIAPALESARLNAELVESEASLRENNRTLAEASRLKSEFLAKMSHELRTPLSAIIGFSDLILDGSDGELNSDLAEDVTQINRSGKVLLELINDILDLSKIEAGRMQLEIEPVNLVAIVGDVAGTLKPLADAKGLSLRAEVEEPSLVVACDPMRTRQVILNLASNAIKFTAEGGVTVRCVRNGSSVEVSVIDTGIGIPADMQEKIFDEFVQADGGIARKFGGTGLGLSISKKLVDMQGGNLHLESEVGRGSRFWFSLQLLDAVPVEAVHRLVARPAVNRAIAGATRDVILVVDDEEAIRNLISRRLQDAGFATIEAANGEEAVSLARREHPAAITLDIVMPRTDGWHVLRKLKASRATRDIPVVVVSIVEGRQASVEMGAAGYLTKPFSGTQLVRSINRVLPQIAGADILCVDDEAPMRELIRKSLSPAGVNVRLACSGFEALDEVDRKIPDAILTDLMMPEMSGFELIFKLRNRPALNKVPIIVVSARDLDDGTLTALNGAIESFVSKAELTDADLGATIRQAIHSRSDQPTEVGTEAVS